MIIPTNGRVVWFTPPVYDTAHSSYGKAPWAAHVCHVWHDRMVNLMVIQPDGQTRIETSVALLQDDDAAPPEGRYAEWMPYQKAQAEKAEAVEGPKQGSRLNFGDALAALKAGNRVAREGWNGKGMFLFLVSGSRFKVNRAPLLGIYAEGTEIDYHAHIDMKTAHGYVVPWLASQADMLADDWSIVA